MEIVNHEVIHKAFGKGTIIEQDNAILTVRFSCGEKRFQYPEAFRTFLRLSEDALNMAVQEEINQFDRTKLDAMTAQSPMSQAITKQKAVKRSRDERPNIAFKCNYCDGGASDKSVGFNGVCSDAIIYNNIEVEHRTWCCSEDCSCPRYLNGEITRKELDKMCEDGGLVCYESQMLRDWKAMAGFVQNGDRKGQPMHLNQVQPNSLCILTTRDPNSTEDERYIFAAFLVDDTYGGDDLTEGFVTTRSEFRLQLSPEEAHKMLFWNYHANGKQPETAAWNSGLHRYMTDEQAAQILRDIAALKQDTRDTDLAQRFFEKFCTLTRIDTNTLRMPQGALKQENSNTTKVVSLR
ncbi:hypothetical protein [uncultured Oscillibacter sp.]|uniref:hypothetical protein n=1 Tax=uncultured Oscillibacter sp. TaxID=876091 RepID=UPI0025F925DF|nr:hypothetical protein [uncultured Oscillibacter sp.]